MIDLYLCFFFTQSANGIFINGRPQQAKVMIELQINDLIGLGCPDTKPFVPHNPANGAEGTNKVQIKTIFRLKLPEVSFSIQLKYDHSIEGIMFFKFHMSDSDGT